jgi:DNA-binding MarR family transcriptional regulator
MVQPQDLVITLLGAYVHPHQRTVWSGGLVTLLDEFGFSTGAARVALTRLVRRELLTRQRDGRLVHYALTPRAEALLDEGDRRIFSLGRAPHRADTWTVLWHSVPEERRLERSRLARRLRFLGFGSVQDGTWISPHDREREVAALLAELGLTEQAGVLRGRPRRWTSARWPRAPGTSRSCRSATAPSPRRSPARAPATTARRSSCARAWCTRSAGSRSSTPSCPTSSCRRPSGAPRRSRCSTGSTPRSRRPRNATSTS